MPTGDAAGQTLRPWLVLGLTVALLAPTAAQAQQSDEEKAKEYYRKGTTAFHKGNYGVALSNFKRANSLMTSGTLLYNISISYSRLDQPEKALEFANKAKGRDDLPDDTAVKNRARIKGYRAALKSKELVEAAQPKGSADNESTSSTTTTAETDDDTTGGGETTGSSGGSGLLWTGAAMGVAGAGSLGVATYLNFAVSDKIDRMKEAESAGKYEKADGLYQDLSDQRQLGRILVYSGAGLVAIGGTLLIVDLASGGGGQADAIRFIGGPTRDGWRVGLDLQF